jgi:hypothetical protein
MRHWKAVLFAFLATLSYTSETVIADQKLARTTPLLLTFLVGVGTASISLFLLMTSSGKIAWPGRTEYGWLILVILLTFCADWMHFASLHNKVGAAVLCTSYALMPVLASAMKAEMPSGRLILAWICGSLALVLASQEVMRK